MVLYAITFSIMVVQNDEFRKTVFENKQYGPGGGIPLLKSLWEKFDISLLFLQNGIVKHSGVSGWLLAFAYICGMIAQMPSFFQLVGEHNFDWVTKAKKNTVLYCKISDPVSRKEQIPEDKLQNLAA